jgi:hypothetical protein
MKQRLLAASVALMLAVGTAQAALLDLHNGQLYDNVTNLVWLQDANLAVSTSFDERSTNTHGFMTWHSANSFIAAMNTANYLGHSDWMLPTVSPVAGGNNWNYSYSTNGTTDYGYNISSQTSQLGYMYYQNLGLKGFYSPSGDYQPDFGVFGNGISGAFGLGVNGGQANVGLVNNLQSYGYWSGTAYAPLPTQATWYFGTHDGSQVGYYNQNNALAVWPVRPATALDVAATVPEPESYAMFLAGLGLMGAFARRRKQK